jgi:acetyl/propionyl-CoA carboxylase alpha subunit
LIVSGKDRQQTVTTARAALDAFQVAGVPTSIPFHRGMLDEPDFLSGSLRTRWIEQQRSA